ncbi:hypothetical protein BH10ACI3_BH10ACI3_16790 [soil metagenome]
MHTHKINRGLFLAIIFIFGSIGINAATFTAAASGDWATPATWTLNSGTDPDGVPDADDTVTVPSGRVVTVSSAQSVQSLAINTGGTLTLNAGSTLTMAGGGSYSGLGIVNGTGTFRTQGATTFGGSTNFTAPLEVNSGTTLGSGNIGGSLTVLSGAILNTTNQNFTVDGDLANSGTVTKSSGTFRVNGANIVNNGTISGAAFTFGGTGTQSLSGTGSFTASITALSGSVTTLTSDVTFGNGNVTATDLILNTGSTRVRASIKDRESHVPRSFLWSKWRPQSNCQGRLESRLPIRT